MSRIGQFDNHVLVAAIDFGTTFSGYAFSFKSDPTNIKMNKNWGENFSFQSYKTATSVLVDSNKQFVDFGFDAEQKYSETIEEEDSTQTYHMFRHFKMSLHNQGVTRYTEIRSVDGIPCSAMDIFAMALKYLSDHLLAALAKQTNQPSANLIKWVITVPAIWGDSAKQFMREAAQQASLIKSKNSKNLEIALEPEAASMFCRELKVDEFVEGCTTEMGFQPGVKYLIIDAGGGTIDITAHEVLPEGRVKEVFHANGGAWGGTKVDQAFLDIMSKVFSKDFMEMYQRKCPRQFLDIMLKFELAKKSVNPYKTGKIVIPISWNMADRFQKFSGNTIEDTASATSPVGVRFFNGSLILQPEAYRTLFESVTEDIVNHLQKIYQKPAVTDCKFFLLVGGFGECTFLQKAIKEKFEPGVRVLVPIEAQMSVIKGAVKYGHSPSSIKSRICKRTYGDKNIVPFIPEIHDTDYKVLGQPKCRNVFVPYVNIGEEVDTGLVKTFSIRPHHPSQTTMLTEIYAIDHRVSPNVPEYVDKPGFQKVGQFSVTMPDTSKGLDRLVKFEVKFGGTEIQVRAIDQQSGNEAETAIDFLTG